MINYTDNSKQVIKQLKKIHGGLATVMSNTVNRGANLLYHAYEKELNEFTLRNRFTKGAIKRYLSKPKSSKGSFRAVDDINAIVGVRKMKGGKDHYLLDQEKGGVKRGHSDTMGRVAIPLDTARTSESHNRPVRSALRLQKSPIQNLSLGGQPFGVKDGFHHSQRWAILNRLVTQPPSGMDLKKPFYFEGSTGLGVYVQKGKKFKKIRDLDETTVIIKPTHKFENSFEKVTPSVLESVFISEGRKKIPGFK